MHHQSSITSLSGIPAEAVEGSTKLAFERGVAHYDQPPPEKIEDIQALRDADRFRFPNVPRAWKIRKVTADEAPGNQDEAGSEVFLLLDGVLRVDEDGARLAEYGPGAMLGERAHLESGGRTWPLVSVTACKVAALEASELDRDALQELCHGHRRTTPDRS